MTSDDAFIKKLGTIRSVDFYLCEDDSTPGLFKIEANYHNLVSHCGEDAAKEAAIELTEGLASFLKDTGIFITAQPIKILSGNPLDDVKGLRHQLVLEFTLKEISKKHNLESLANVLRPVVEKTTELARPATFPYISLVTSRLGPFSLN